MGASGILTANGAELGACPSQMSLTVVIGDSQPNPPPCPSQPSPIAGLDGSQPTPSICPSQPTPIAGLGGSQQKTQNFLKFRVDIGRYIVYNEV